MNNIGPRYSYSLAKFSLTGDRFITNEQLYFADHRNSGCPSPSFHCGSRRVNQGLSCSGQKGDSSQIAHAMDNHTPLLSNGLLPYPALHQRLERKK